MVLQTLATLGPPRLRDRSTALAGHRRRAAAQHGHTGPGSQVTGATRAGAWSVSDADRQARFMRLRRLGARSRRSGLGWIAWDRWCRPA